MEEDNNQGAEINHLLDNNHSLNHHEDSGNSRERFMIHRRMSNTGIVNLS
jgi:hypothetical protein